MLRPDNKKSHLDKNNNTFRLDTNKNKTIKFYLDETKKKIHVDKFKMKNHHTNYWL